MARPSFQFYPDDWMNDLALRACSALARCIWIDLICMMHQGVPYGHLSDTAGPVPIKVLASRCGVTIKQLLAALEELETHQVFSKSESGVIFSRRMVRDEYKRQVRGAGGSESSKNPNVPRAKSPGKGYLSSDEKVSLSPEDEERRMLLQKNSGIAIFDPLPGWSPFKLAYPSHKLNEFTDLRLWMSIVDSQKTQDQIMQCLLESKKSRQWQDPQMIPKASTWLGERQFCVPPPPQTGPVSVRKLSPVEQARQERDNARRNA